MNEHEQRARAQVARLSAAALRRRAYDRLAIEATSDIDAADFLAAGLARFVPTYSPAADRRAAGRAAR